jgi:Lipocalin-like domain
VGSGGILPGVLGRAASVAGEGAGDGMSGQDTGAAAVVGAWRLVRWEVRREDGAVTSPFGPGARGYLLYTEQGVMSATLSAADRPPFASDDPLAATDAEGARASRTYSAYCGHYEVRGDTVVHHVELCSYPNWVGTDLERRLELEGDRLILSTPPVVRGGIRQTSRLVWERA